METPLHHHYSTGGSYPHCKRCKLERAAPALFDACKATIDIVSIKDIGPAKTKCKNAIKKAIGE